MRASNRKFKSVVDENLRDTSHVASGPTGVSRRRLIAVRTPFADRHTTIAAETFSLVSRLSTPRFRDLNSDVLSFAAGAL